MILNDNQKNKFICFGKNNMSYIIKSKIYLQIKLITIYYFFFIIK